MSTMQPSRVAVLGPGGVGGLVGALLARAGHRVIFLGGPDTAQALREHGVRVRSGTFGDFAVQVEADTELREPVDACLVTVKQHALGTALDRVPAAALGDGLIVPLLNGIEHPAVLRERYRPDRVAPGVIRVESTRTAPGSIVHGSPFAEIDLASSTAPRERLDALAAVLDGAGVRAQVRDDETAMLWGKLFFLAPFALTTTRYRCPVGDIRTRHRAELLALLTEIAEVSRACGVPADIDAALRFYDGFPAEAKSSMQRDAEAGRPLELDAIGGALLRMAQQHSVPVRLTERLVEEVGRLSTGSTPATAEP
ncbi:ketopantoate reductase family protein [Nocardia transvalensis]|uniref:ketopantoate reductase family protein n=1 Tax=Nocardia transvalensis TaxID=37333 RepID=UPI001895AC58|nr:2-dehydropantoate 2-reductase [Nocardia transvalensis]MBF6328288.1 2-dehydropantoate 2-reductase [Nocardia transvalensis]